MDSGCALIEARQHCVAKTCNASQRANADKLQNDPFTISSSVLWTHLRAETFLTVDAITGNQAFQNRRCDICFSSNLDKVATTTTIY